MRVGRYHGCAHDRSQKRPGGWWRTTSLFRVVTQGRERCGRWRTRARLGGVAPHPLFADDTRQLDALVTVQSDRGHDVLLDVRKGRAGQPASATFSNRACKNPSLLRGSTR